VKVLLDENLPHRLRHRLGNHEAVTVRYMGWAGLKNGELLKAAEEAGFEVFVTGDQTLSYEQNLAGRRIAVLVLSTIDRDILKSNATLIVAALDDVTLGSLQQVDCGAFSRKRQRDEE
jgi:predicted nuclease of predicted toxin-antitoxin system